MAQGKTNDGEFADSLRKLGLEEVPALPNGFDVEKLLRRDDEFDPIISWCRSEGLSLCLDESFAAFGAGATCMEDGTPAVALLVAPEVGAEDVPESIECEDGVHPVKIFRVDPSFQFTQRFVRRTGALAGSAVGSAADLNSSGTLSGIFPGSGGVPWAVTNTHVALGFGFEKFLANLPASLLWLFESPRGEELLASSPIQTGQQLVRLAEIRTSVRVLQPLPMALLAGVVVTIYVDVAAGPVNIQPFAAPPPPPAVPTAVRQTVQFTPFGGSRNARPGEGVYAYGQQLGLRWGNVAIVGLTLPLPLPIPLPAPTPIIVILHLDVFDMPIMAGDSGMTAIASSDNRPLAICGLGLGATQPNDINPLTLATPSNLVRGFISEISF